jgi:hypothetical protein
MPTDEKRRALRRFKLGHPEITYAPVRSNQLDILNVQPGPLVDCEATPWPIIEQRIRRACKSKAEADANVAVGEALYNRAQADGFVGRHEEFFSLAVGLAAKVQYWSNAIIRVAGRPRVIFIDPRRSSALTAVARLFAFSAMNERIRAADPDYAEIGFAIAQFACQDDGSRRTVLHLDDDLPLFDFDTLDRMVRETYEIWAEVLEEREASARRGGTGTFGPLGL